MPTTDHPLVLVLDDEAAIREIQRRILEKAGFRVIEASSGADAFTLLEGMEELDLLIADLEMPELGGEEVVRRIRLARPDLKVLYVTGHIDRLLDARSTLWEGEAFLDKPFTPRGLLEAVSLLLYGKLPVDPE
jgi:two-component system cell cycle sensor histidine kinase/response regulator CckA